MITGIETEPKNATKSFAMGGPSVGARILQEIWCDYVIVVQKWRVADDELDGGG